MIVKYRDNSKVFKLNYDYCMASVLCFRPYYDRTVYVLFFSIWTILNRIRSTNRLALLRVLLNNHVLNDRWHVPCVQNSNIVLWVTHSWLRENAYLFQNIFYREWHATKEFAFPVSKRKKKQSIKSSSIRYYEGKNYPLLSIYSIVLKSKLQNSF